MADIVTKCRCYPDYIDLFTTWVERLESSWLVARNLTAILPCTFTQHMNCVSTHIRGFAWRSRKVCPLECTGYRFHRESVQYKLPRIGNNGKFATIKYVMAEVMAVVLAETETYPLSACISDTGGAAGLFLGLNVIGILSLLKKTSQVSKMNCRKLNLF